MDLVLRMTERDTVLCMYVSRRVVNLGSGGSEEEFKGAEEPHGSCGG